MAIRKRKAGGFNSFTACISTAMVLVLLGTVVFFVSVADNLGRTMKENFSVQVLLSDSISKSQTYELQTFLRQQKPVRTVSYTSKEKATKEQAEVLGSDPEEFLGNSPYPASFELLLKADYADNDSLGKYMKAVKARPFVTDVIYPEDLMEAVNSNINTASLVLLAIALLLGFVSFALISNTMRFSAYANRYSIYTMRLIGARQSFIRRPYLRQAFWIGLIASLLAIALLWAALQVLLSWDEGIRTLLTSKVLVFTCGTVIVTGLLLTVICAFFSVTRFLRLSGDQIHLQ
ncbi:MAG: permease-like cell division protein FtsX [Bacteroidaceae bacterium]|nr:permease-like cell division protein FtsX [Bacteroidaceae bacterium]